MMYDPAIPGTTTRAKAYKPKGERRFPVSLVMLVGELPGSIENVQASGLLMGPVCVGHVEARLFLGNFCGAGTFGTR